MPAIPKIVVWSSYNDIQILKNLFYTDSDSESARKAVKLVLAYSTRGPVPHSVESTAFITDAILQDNKSNNPFTVRLAYSMALVRFVNGLVDPLQQGQYAQPIYSLAAELQLPSYFVDLRHSATHEALPSIEILREISGRALDWLWTHYWSVNTINDNTLDPAELEIISNEIKDLFREWRRLRRGDPSQELKKGDQSKDSIAAWTLINRIKDKLQTNEQLVMDVMLQKNVLIPKGYSQASAALLFGPLLQHLEDEGFISRLACYGIDVINNIQSNKETMKENWSENFCEIWTEWTKYLLTDQLPKTTEKRYLNSSEAISAIIESCLEYPNKYNLEILKCCMTLKSDAVRPELEHLIEDIQNHLSNTEKITSDSQEIQIPSKRDISQVIDEVSELKSKLKSLKTKDTSSASMETVITEKQVNGWKLVENWTPRPLGVL